MGSYSYYTNSTRILLPGLDVVIIFGAFRLASYQQAGNWVFKGNYPLLFAVFALLWWILSDRYANIYRTNPLLSYGERFMRLFGTCLLHAGIVLSAAMLLATSWLSSSYLLTVYGLILAGVVAGRFLLTFLRRTFYQVIGQSHNSFVIVGVSPSAQEFHSFLTSNNAADDQFRGFFTNDAVPTNLQPLVQGQVSALKEYCLKEQINDIYFALPLDQHELIEDLSRFADQHFISFRIIPDFQGTVRKDVNVYFYDHLPVLTIRQNPLGFPTNQVVKRLFDICFSGAVILMVFPLILPILALLIKLDSPGPVFFQQLRPGKRHQLFPCYKLRTMRADHGRAELQATAA
ncbi:sugar transferase, partial [Hymenobacter sp.]|uniref:sugar transferase n=1 Tax=Hymenobacter sp. TaxID=1898978 RepID=UPI002ED9F6D9